MTTGLRRVARFLCSEPALVAGCTIVFALVASHPLWGHFGDIDTVGDWDYFFQLQWVAYHTVTKFHQLPLWNPYKCGGAPLLGNPQSHIFTPWFALTMLLGPFAGLHMEIPVHVAIAWAGAYALARVAGARPLGAIGSAMAFGASSWFYLRMGAGGLVTFGYVYLPWSLAAVLMAAETNQPEYSIGAGLALALAFLEAGPYPVMFGVLGFALVLLPRSVIDRSIRPIIALVETGVWAAGFSAIKLVPSTLWMLQHPRPAGDIEANGLGVLWTALFESSQHTLMGSPNGWGFWEIGAYLGLFAIPAVIGFMRPRIAATWIIAGVILLALSLGDAVPWGLWPLLHKVPLFDSLRLPSRLLILFILVVGVMAALGFDWIASLKPPYGLYVSVFLLALCSINSMLVGPPILSDVLNNQSVAGPPINEFKQIARGPGNNSMLIPAMQNEGVVRCYEYVNWDTPVRSEGTPGYLGEQYIDGSGTVRVVRWTPNALSYEVDASAPTVLVINQNYDAPWRLQSGHGEVVSQGGLLAVRLPAGRQEITLRYFGIPFLSGAAITFTFAVMALWILRKRIWPAIQEE